jgi:hypothetical protein
VVGVCLLVVAALLTIATIGSGDAVDASAAPAVSASLGPPRRLAPPVEGTRAIPGFAPRTIPAVAVVDGALLVFGGSRPYAGGDPARPMLDDGVLVAPDGRTARRVPEAPFRAPLYSPNAVGVDGQAVVVGVQCARAFDEDSADPRCEPGTTAAAVLDLRDGGAAWRSVDLPKDAIGDYQSGGRAVGASVGGEAVFHFPGGIYAFDPARDRWRKLPAAGVDARTLRDACITGDTLVVVSKETIETGPAGSVAAPVVHTLDLGSGGGWRRSVLADGTARNVGGMEITGLIQVVSCAGDLVVVSQPGQLELTRAYSLVDRRWFTPPRAPRGVMAYTSVWTGDEVVFLPNTTDVRRVANAYRPETNTWRFLERVPQEQFGGAWDGRAIVGYTEPHPGGPDGELTESGVYRYVVPPPPAAGG